MRAGTAARAGTGPLVRILALGGGRALAALLGFAAVLLLAPRVGPATLGLWSMLLAVQGWALHLSEMGLRSVVTAEAAATRGGARSLLPVYLGTRLMLASLVVLACLAAAARLAADQLLPLALVLSSLFAIALQLDWLALVDDRPVQAGLLLLVRPAAFCTLLLLAGHGLDLDRLAALFALAWGLAALASWPLLAAPAPPARGGEASLGPLRLLRLGAPVAFVTLTNQGLLTADTFLVGSVLGPARAGPFYLASALAIAGLVVANAMNQIATARMGRLRTEPPAFRAELVDQLRRATVVGVLVALLGAAVGPSAIAHLFGADFEPAAPLFLAFLPWLALQHPSAVLSGALLAARRQPVLLRANLVMALVQAVCLLAALLLGSVLGCALARSVAEMARLAVLVRALARGGAGECCNPIAVDRPRIRSWISRDRCPPDPGPHTGSA